MTYGRRTPSTPVLATAARRLTTTVVLTGIVAVAGAGGCAAGEQTATTVVETTIVGTTVGTTVTTSRTVTETVAADEGREEQNAGKERKNEIRFTGNGDTSLPPFRVMRGGAILRWANSGEVFSLFGPEGTLVDSVGARGETFLPGGIHRIDVVASGSWLIIVPRSRRIR
jgi:hypothetical protein